MSVNSGWGSLFASLQMGGRGVLKLIDFVLEPKFYDRKILVRICPQVLSYAAYCLNEYDQNVIFAVVEQTTNEPAVVSDMIAAMARPKPPEAVQPERPSLRGCLRCGWL